MSEVEYNKMVDSFLRTIFLVAFGITLVIIIYGLIFKTYSECAIDPDTLRVQYCNTVNDASIAKKTATLFNENSSTSFIRYPFAVAMCTVLIYIISLINRALYRKHEYKVLRRIYCYPLIILICCSLALFGTTLSTFGFFITFVGLLLFFRHIFFIDFLMLFGLFLRNRFLKDSSKDNTATIENDNNDNLKNTNY